jgi:hypothetical protein
VTRKLDLFPFSGEGENTYSIGSLRKKRFLETNIENGDFHGRVDQKNCLLENYAMFYLADYTAPDKIYQNI